MIHITINPTPLQLADDEKPIPFIVEKVNLLVQENKYEFSTKDDYAAPDVNCWFCVKIVFPNLYRPDGVIDSEMIITNGDEFYLANNSLVARERKYRRVHLNK